MNPNEPFRQNVAENGENHFSVFGVPILVRLDLNVQHVSVLFPWSPCTNVDLKWWLVRISSSSLRFNRKCLKSARLVEFWLAVDPDVDGLLDRVLLLGVECGQRVDLDGPELHDGDATLALRGDHLVHHLEHCPHVVPRLLVTLQVEPVNFQPLYLLEYGGRRFPSCDPPEVPKIGTKFVQGLVFTTEIFWENIFMDC